MSPAPSEPTPPQARRKVRELRDFSDRLPAVLVKELRQGLRGKLFATGFCVLHALLVMGSIESGRSAGKFFWFCLSMMFIFLLPSRTLSALGEERDERTLDTLVLTRLTPWRIVWGKWAASAALAALTAVSVLPYLFVRYLNGGTAFVTESAILLLLLFIYGAVAAIFTAISIIRSPLLRNAVAIITGLGAYYLAASPAIRWLGQSDTYGTRFNPGWLFSTMLLCVWAVSYALWKAAGSIAPLTANPAAPRRFVSLAGALLCLLAAILAYLFDDLPSTARWLWAMSVIIVISAFGELGDSTPPGHIPFLWRRPFPRTALWFLSPGRGPGFCFSALLAGLWAAIPDHLMNSALNRFDGEDMVFTAPHLIVLLSAAVVFRALLPRSMSSGTTPLVVLMILSHVAGTATEELLGPAGAPVRLLFPGTSPPGHSLPTIAPLWAAAAVLTLLREWRILAHRPRIAPAA